MSIHHTRFYWLECDECGEPSDSYQYGSRESEEFKGRATRFARTMASRDGWSAFSDRDLCPEHSHKKAAPNGDSGAETR